MYRRIAADPALRDALRQKWIAGEMDALKEIGALPPFPRADIDRLIGLIHSGKNTFADIRRAFPHMDLRILHRYIADSWSDDPILDDRLHAALHPLPTSDILAFEAAPEDYSPLYSFRDGDRFQLTPRGDDLWYHIDKEQRLLALTEKSVSIADRAKDYALYSVLATVIFGFIALFFQ